MKVVILAGGLGTRLAEETQVKPKPMVEIGGFPILWHIMKGYASFGFNEFMIALGYKGDAVKKYFLDYYALAGSKTVHLCDGKVECHTEGAEDWVVHLMETGLNTMTGGRLKRLEPWLADSTFMLTYGDGVSDVDLGALLRNHRASGRIATVTAVRPPARFGELIIEGNKVSEFNEKPQVGEAWINGGFMVFEPAVFQYIEAGDETVLERDVLTRLSAADQLSAYCHPGFWQCMDTLRDLRLLESLWNDKRAPWKTWE